MPVPGTGDDDSPARNGGSESNSKQVPPCSASLLCEKNHLTPDDLPHDTTCTPSAMAISLGSDGVVVDVDRASDAWPVDPAQLPSTNAMEVATSAYEASRTHPIATGAYCPIASVLASAEP